jgi:hypothetical protein
MALHVELVRSSRKQLSGRPRAIRRRSRRTQDHSSGTNPARRWQLDAAPKYGDDLLDGHTVLSYFTDYLADLDKAGLKAGCGLDRDDDIAIAYIAGAYNKVAEYRRTILAE